jgi:uncharacterized damage-inducible protein DinB
LGGGKEAEMGELKDKLRRSLADSHDKSPWHSVVGALEGLTEDEFQWRPAKYKGFSFMSGSIHDILFHVASDKLVSISVAYGDKSFTWKSVAEQPEVKAGTLVAALALLARAQASVVALLDSLADEDLAKTVTVEGPRTMTGERFFDMMVEHDLYHAGQIQYIRSLIKAQ